MYGGYIRVQGPVMEFLNVAHMERQRIRASASNEEAPSAAKAPSSSSSSSSSRRRQVQQLSVDASSDTGAPQSGTRAAPGLTLLVVRPRLPDGCMPLNTMVCDSGCPPANRLVGGCDVAVSGG